jgi:hypothetical protein
MENNLQKLVLQTFINDEGYCRKAMPHVKPEYFEGGERVAYELMLEFILKYNKLPTTPALMIELERSTNGSLETRNQAAEILTDLQKPEKVDLDWLLHQTEKWCQERSVFLAVMESIAIIDGKRKDVAPGMIPNILQKALSVTFDTNVGHDYLENAPQRYEYYHKKESRLPFDIEMLNSITRGGVPKKTLNIVMAGVNVGKSLVMCHLAASYLSQGKNVLYITLEMSEERIAERIDANLFDVTLDQIEALPRDVFDSKVKKIAAKTQGKLIIKEYPTAAGHSGHFRALLNELKMKKNFIPEIIFIDYIGICSSARVKGLSGSVNTNSFVKAVSEELRGLAIEFNVPIWTATQVNRSGMCLDLNTMVVNEKNEILPIKDIKIGDYVLSSNGNYNRVLNIFPITKKKMFRIRTKSGKEIISSEDHLFPTYNGNEKTIKSGLKVGDSFISTDVEVTDIINNR